MGKRESLQMLAFHLLSRSLLPPRLLQFLLVNVNRPNLSLVSASALQQRNLRMITSAS